MATKKPLILNAENYSETADFTLAAEFLFKATVCCTKGKTGKEAERWVNKQHGNFERRETWKEFTLDTGKGGQCDDDLDRYHYVFNLYFGTNL